MAKRKKGSKGCRVGWGKKRVRTGSKRKLVSRCVPLKGTKVGGKRRKRGKRR